jgi:hypothetical protein
VVRNLTLTGGNYLYKFEAAKSSSGNGITYNISSQNAFNESMTILPTVPGLSIVSSPTSEPIVLIEIGSQIAQTYEFYIYSCMEDYPHTSYSANLTCIWTYKIEVQAGEEILL